MHTQNTTTLVNYKSFPVEPTVLCPKDRKGWAARAMARAKQIDPSDHDTAAAAVSILPDGNAEEWLKGAEAHDGRFKG